jgi:hypothetical protein
LPAVDAAPVRPFVEALQGFLNVTPLFLGGLDDRGRARVVGEIATRVGVAWRTAVVRVGRLDAQGGNGSVELGDHLFQPFSGLGL